MSRERKYRAWTRSSYEWDEPRMVYWNFLENDGCRVEGDYSASLDQEDPIMDYTGLKDKNGKEIYEGDICRHGHEDLFTVIFENSAYRKQYPDWDNTLPKPFITQRDVETYSIQVIGNIYDNPELSNTN